MCRPPVVVALLVCTLLALVPGRAAIGQPRAASPSGDVGMVQRLLDLAVSMRSSTPDVAPISGAMSISVLRLQLGAVITIRPEGQPVWGYLHTLFSHPDDGPAEFCDAVFLTPRETARQFFEATVIFRSPMDAKFVTDCMLVGERVSTSGVGYPYPPGAYRSETRALIHLGGFLELFARYDIDRARAADFAKIGLQRWREVLAVANAEGLAGTRGALKLFDQAFPAAVLTPDLRLDAEGKAAARALFQTTVQLRRKLKPLAPELGANLARDESLRLQYEGAL